MRNLAGHPDATALFLGELTEACIAHAPSNESDGETRCAFDGLVYLPGGFALRVTRRWLYASARITPPLPVDAAVALAALPTEAGGTKYSEECGCLGGVARAAGSAGGLFAERLRRFCPEGVGLWHCDSTAALADLVAGLRGVIAERGLTAPTAEKEYRRVTTGLWLGDCAEHLRSGGRVASAVRRDLHSNADLDADDPRIVQLRAEFPRTEPADE